VLQSLETINLTGWPFSVLGIAYGQGTRLQLEVLYSEHNHTPSPTQLRSAWKARQEGRGVPLLVVVLAEGKAHVCGPSGEDPTVYPSLDVGQVERICQEALEQPSRQAALRALRDSLGSVEEEGLPGLRNEGFLANHELTNRVPARDDWITARDRAQAVMNHTGMELLSSLGFSASPLDNVTHVLCAGDHKTAVAVLLTEQETPEAGSERMPGSLSPVSYALNRADEENLDWVVLIHGRKIRLYPVKMIGVGRRGRTETYLECHTGLLPDDQAGYLWLLFSADALSDGGSLSEVLEESRNFAGDLAERLRDRIYDDVIPRLAEGLAAARRLKNPTAKDLGETYQMAMRILFRLLFIAYGEDKDLLPYRYNGLYQKRSLKTKAKDLLEHVNSGTEFGDGDSWWQEIRAIFHAVDKGNPSWGVPAYNGGLFSIDPEESPLGALLEDVSLPDNVFGPALQHLLLVPTAEDVLGPVDFRSLGVREFGTIYEGLLESELSVAETDLVVEQAGRNKDAFRPAGDDEEPEVRKGKIYLHNSSGARKSTGSYYTKRFAVEHLLDHSLEPALDDHFARLDDLEELEAAESFFDFKVADIAMGSGHFLIAAVDRIEARFSGYLAKRHLAHVFAELVHLRQEALAALGDAADSYPDLEDNALLRRLIAKRCIYGVDLNEVAVQLARLAVWVHTFVPGLPLSLLDRNLVHGNSLIGVGQLTEIEDYERGEDTMILWEANAPAIVGDASDALSRMGRLADANRIEIQQARQAWADADAATAPAKSLCDMLTAARIEDVEMPFDITRWDEEKGALFGGTDHTHALDVLEGTQALHFPVTFPEVFLRERAGFDVILGNPPWEEATVEEDAFWARHFPGLRGMNQLEQEQLKSEYRESRPDLVEQLEKEISEANALRNALVRGPFPGMGTGDPDLYKAFCWRFWFLTAEDDGRIGVVLPRSALAAKGSEEFRWRVFTEACNTDVTMILNNRHWFFEDVHPQYTIGLVALHLGSSKNPSVSLAGPYNSRAAFDAGLKEAPAVFSSQEVLSWNDSASLPLLPTASSVGVFAQLRKTPRLDLNEPEQWRARPHTELHATNDKTDRRTGQILMDLQSVECPKDHWPVFKGKSFDLWNPDTGTYYAWGDTKALLSRIQGKRERGNNLRSSVFSECDTEWCRDPDTLPCLHPRIAFRDITRSTDTRTVRCALIPPNVFITNKGPYFVFPEGGIDDVAYLLGVLSSIPLDWYARCFVEITLNFFILNPFPIPRPDANNPLRKRVIELAGRLACPDDRFADWAKEVGVECGPLEDDEKQEMIHELDAVVAHLYDLTQEHLIHIFETFHVGWDYNARLEATLEHYDAWKSKA
jgi:hypothetical protein